MHHLLVHSKLIKLIYFFVNLFISYSGYMAPEYLVGGLFSVKSDVFSLGVLVLEIISGKKNAGFNQSSSFNLPEYVSY